MVTGDTAGATQKFAGNASVGNCYAGNHPGPDLVYAVQPSASGTLSVTFTPTYDDGMVHVRTSCPGSVMDEVGCHAGNAPNMAQSLSLQVKNGATYYVAAGTYAGTSGPFTLMFSLM